MAMNMVELRYGKHWLWRTNKQGMKLKPRLKSKIKKWLKLNCDQQYRILYGSTAPVIIFNTEIDAMAFKLRWM